LAAIQALGAYVEVSEAKVCKQLQGLVPQLLDTTASLLLADEEVGEEALEVVGDIVESEPKFFLKSFEYYFSTLSNIFFNEKFADSGILKIVTEQIV